MNYMTVKEAAKKWKLSERRVRSLCRNGRIDGVTRMGWIWSIPGNAEKPEDARTIQHRLQKGEKVRARKKNHNDGSVTSEGEKEVDNIDMKELNSLANKYDLDLLVLLGSYGTEYFKPGESDIDIAFLTGGALQGNEYIQFLNDLSIIFQYGKIDAIDLKRASGLIKYEVVKGGRLLYESRTGFFKRYLLYCLRYYYDTKKFRELKKEYFQEKLGVLLDGRS